MSKWPVLPLEAVASSEPRAITDGPFGSNLTSAHYEDSGPQVVRLQNIGDGVYKRAPAHISQSHFESLRMHEVLPDDLLVASLGEGLPRACLMPADIGPAIVKADCIRIRLGADVDRRWVMYSLQRPFARKWAEEHLHGVGRPRLGLKLIRQIPVPLPPLAEQRRVVDILEDHLSRLDAADRALATQTQKIDSLRLATLAGHRVAAMRAGAPARRIGDVATTDLGKMLDAKRAAGSLTPYLRNINVRWHRFDIDDMREVPLTEAERQRFALRPGDLMVCEGGEPGRCAVWTGSEALVTFQKALHRVRPNATDADAHYLALMLELSIRRGGADSLFTGTTIKHLPQEKLRAIELPMPSVPDQLAIVEAVAQSSAGYNALSEAIDRGSRRSARLRQALLAAAFSGKLTGAASDSDIIEELAG